MPAHRSYTSGLVEPPGVSYGGDLHVGDDLVVDGDLAIAGAFTVPNPAPGPSSAVSLAELLDRVAAEPLLTGAEHLHVGSLSPPSPLFPAENTVAETSIMQSALVITHSWPDRSGAKLTAFGTLRNASGAPMTFTFRLRDQTASNFVMSQTAVTLATDAAQRAFRLQIDLHKNQGVSPGVYSFSKLEVAAQGADPRQESLHQVAQNITGFVPPHNLMLSVQMSVAHADGEVRMSGADVIMWTPEAA